MGDGIEIMSAKPSKVDKEHTFSWNWKDLLIIFAGIMVILFLGVLIFMVVTVASGENIESLLAPTISQTIMLTALEAAALILGVYFFGLRRRNIGWESIGLKSTSGSWILISITATLALIPIVSIITILVLFLSGQPMDNPQLDFLLPEGLSVFDAVLMFLLAGFLAPFGEELLFRGVLYKFIRDKWGIWIGVIVSSLLFGLIHGNLAVGLTGFFVGIMAAMLYEYSKSLWTAIIVHIINNSSKIALLYLLVWLGFEV